MSSLLLDCTLRDGGYVNNWDFSFDFGEALYRSASEAGCHYVEVGFIGEEGGMWANVDDGVLKSLREGCSNGAGLAVMLNYGTLETIKTADMIRVASHQETVEEATKMAKALRKGETKTCVNFMGISNYDEDDLGRLIELIQKHKDGVDFFYIADSFGSLLPSEVGRLIAKLKMATGARIGFHPHNNLQLALANSIEAVNSGADILDASVYGMGRGGGNLNLEGVLAYFQNIGCQQFSIVSILEFADLYMTPLREKYSWGYSLPHLLSGALKCHPNYPTNLLSLKSHTADQIYHLLQELPESTRSRYSRDALGQAKKAYGKRFTAEGAVSGAYKKLCKKSKGRAMLLCNGYSLRTFGGSIKAYAEKGKYAVFGVNNPSLEFEVDGFFFGNPRRLFQHREAVESGKVNILGPHISEHVNIPGALRSLKLSADEAFPFTIPMNSGVQAAMTLLANGYDEVLVAGMDGFQEDMPNYSHSHDDGGFTVSKKRLNELLLEELAAARSVAEGQGKAFNIITPTLFEDYFEDRLNLNSVVS